MSGFRIIRLFHFFVPRKQATSCLFLARCLCKWDGQLFFFKIPNSITVHLTSVFYVNQVLADRKVVSRVKSICRRFCPEMAPPSPPNGKKKNRSKEVAHNRIVKRMAVFLMTLSPSGVDPPSGAAVAAVGARPIRRADGSFWCDRFISRTLRPAAAKSAGGATWNDGFASLFAAEERNEIWGKKTTKLSP